MKPIDLQELRVGFGKQFNKRRASGSHDHQL